MKAYRRDIDGLRAIAVSGVLLHHYQVPYFPSGFVGVDIFFVISGFLVGGIVIDALARNSFIFRDFYKRRLLRIAPAMVVMLLLSTAAAYLTLMPYELRYYGGGVISTLLSVANIWFYNRVSYFNPDLNQEPLIHTWSLGVEEQFYLALPFVLVLLFKFYRAWVWHVLVAIILASFLGMLYKTTTNADAAFYLPFYRVWEFLLGVLVYQYKHRLLIFAKSYSEWLVAGAIGGLLSSLAAFSGESWPNLNALLPVLLTCIILTFGDCSSRSAAFLRAPVMTFIGGISYSLYLYHQPILIFSRQYSNSLGNELYWFLVLLATFFASVLSWIYVEKPFRQERLAKPINALVLIFFPICLIAFSLVANVYKGFPDRLPESVQSVLAYEKSFSKTYEKCLPDRKTVNAAVVANGCVHGANVEPTVAIWGDSYAAILAAPIGDLLAQKGMAVKELTMSACAPIVGLYRENLNHGENCVEWNNLTFNYLIQSKNIKTVIIQSNWIQNLNESWLMRPIIKNGRDELAGLDYSSFMQQSLTGQFQSLVNAGKKVVLVMPIPQAGENIPRSYARRVLNSNQSDADEYRSYEQFERDALNTMQILDRIQNSQGFSKLDVVEHLCDKNLNRCFTVKNGVPLYFDGSHLSLPGVYRIINPIVSSIAQ